MIGQIISKINNAYKKRLNDITAQMNQQYDSYFINSFLKEAPDLTKFEIQEIKHLWGGVIPYLSRGYDFYRALKVIDNFSAKYLPSSYYFPIVESALNPDNHKFNLSHKSLTDILYRDIVKFPFTVLRCYNGMYFDSSIYPINSEKACQIILDEEENLLYKPAFRTVQGMGIKLLSRQDLFEFANAIRKGLTSNSEFVLQRLVPQYPLTKIFNPSSLNCMRITTLNLNGEISVCTRALKSGAPNSIVDNIGTGKKGIAIGINADGSLQKYGFYGNGERSESHNGIIFEGKKIPFFEKIIEAAISLHSVNPVCKIIGWDLALDENNEVVLIEGNAAHPGIAVEQLATGPVFGDRTEEVVSYLSETITRK